MSIRRMQAISRSIIHSRKLIRRHGGPRLSVPRFECGMRNAEYKPKHSKPGKEIQVSPGWSSLLPTDNAVGTHSLSPGYPIDVHRMIFQVYSPSPSQDVLAATRQQAPAVAKSLPSYEYFL